VPVAPIALCCEWQDICVLVYGYCSGRSVITECHTPHACSTQPKTLSVFCLRDPFEEIVSWDVLLRCLNSQETAFAQVPKLVLALWIYALVNHCHSMSPLPGENELAPYRRKKYSGALCSFSLLDLGAL